MSTIAELKLDKLGGSNGFISEIFNVCIDNFSGKILLCTFDEELFSQSLFDAHRIFQPTDIQNASKKRKSQFFTGRYLAKRAMSLFGVCNEDVKIGANRDPIWPEGLTGSISHTSDVACCAITQSVEGINVGIDIEKIIDEFDVKLIESYIVSKSEIELLKNKGNDYKTSLTIGFSAKESFFKAFFPVVRRYFDFLDVEIIDFDGNLNVLDLQFKSETSFGAISSKFRCDFTYCKRHVFTFIKHATPCPILKSIGHS